MDEKQKIAEQAGFAASGLYHLQDFFNREYKEIVDRVHHTIVTTERTSHWTQAEIVNLWAKLWNERVQARIEAQVIKENVDASNSVITSSDTIQ